jgi:hypothetical protein
MKGETEIESEARPVMRWKGAQGLIVRPLASS